MTESQNERKQIKIKPNTLGFSQIFVPWILIVCWIELSFNIEHCLKHFNFTPKNGMDIMWNINFHRKTNRFGLSDWYTFGHYINLFVQNDSHTIMASVTNKNNTWKFCRKQWLNHGRRHIDTKLIIENSG